MAQQERLLFRLAKAAPIQTPLKLNWIKSTEARWLPLLTFNIEAMSNWSGVYTIWHMEPNSRYVRIGQGNIRDRLSEHRKDPDVLAYESKGLYVTWALVPANQQNGVEAFLASKLNPLVGERFPDVPHIPVNLPGT